MLKLVKELEKILSAAVGIQVDRSLCIPNEGSCLGQPEMTVSASGHYFELYVPLSLSDREKKLIQYAIEAYSHQASIYGSAYQKLFLTESGHLDFEPSLNFPMRFWRLQHHAENGAVREVLNSLFSESQVADLAPGICVVLAPQADVVPEEVLDTLETDAMTAVTIAVSRVCTSIDQMHMRYLELDEAESAAEALHLGKRIIRVDGMNFQKFLWRHQKLFLNEPAPIPMIQDSTLQETASVFLDCDLNVTTAARVLGIHRNTLLYRLHRIEIETGIDLKKFEAAADYYFSEILYRFSKQ